MLEVLTMAAQPVSPKNMTRMDRASIGLVLDVMDIFQTIYEKMPIQIARAFLIVATNEGKSGKEYAELMDQPQSTMSRHLLDLSIKSRRKGGEGFGLIEGRSDPFELRRTLYKLTPAGKKLLGEILEATDKARKRYETIVSSEETED